MTRLLYDLEDYLDDASRAPDMPGWLSRCLSAISRTVGETGDLVARHHSTAKNASIRPLPQRPMSRASQ